MKSKNIYFAFTGFIILTSLIALVSAQNDFASCPMGGMMSSYYGSGFVILSWLTYILVIALIIAGIYWLIKSSNKKK